MRGRSLRAVVAGGCFVALLVAAMSAPATATESAELTTAQVAASVDGASVDGPGSETGTLVPASDPRLAFVGRWERHYAGDSAATVNSGSQVQLRFTGRTLTGLFDVTTITVAPELWVTIDDGPRTLVSVNRSEIELAPADLGPGQHLARVDVKDTDQVTNRWLPPLGDAVIVRGFRLAAGAELLSPPKPAAVRMAFYGDSITEGIRALGQPLTPDGADGTRAYANVVGRAFGADIQQVGFGKQGVMRDGVGNVPWAPQSFGYNFQGSVADPAFKPDVVVLLQGSNDSVPTDEQFAPAYLSYLHQVRAAAPDAWIFAMVPLIGRHVAVIRSDVAETADPRIVFVDTAGWLDRKSKLDYTDTVHPTIAGHLKVTSKLVPIISAVTGFPVTSSPVNVTVPEVMVPAVQMPTAESPAGVVTLTATVTVQQVLPESRYAARGTVLVTAPPGFTVDHPRQPYTAAPDGTATLTVTLRGTLPEGASSVTGLVRVLVDEQTEALPVPLVVTASTAVVG